uniref:AGA2 n=1 Tax=Arundo donax TaxID=35708 RepID=A0A0A9BJB7_ARUDO
MPAPWSSSFWNFLFSLMPVSRDRRGGLSSPAGSSVVDWSVPTDCQPSSMMTNLGGAPPAMRLRSPASTPSWVTSW